MAASPLALAVSEATFSHSLGRWFMPYKKEEENDLFEDDFEFVDDEDLEADDAEEDYEEDYEEEVEEVEPAPPPKRAKRTSRSKSKEPAPKKTKKTPAKSRKKTKTKEVAEEPVETDSEPAADEGAADSEEQVESKEPQGPPTDHVVHIYEFREFKRTISREFTSEDADNFAKEFNRTSSNLGRWAVSAGKSVAPAPTI